MFIFGVEGPGLGLGLDLENHGLGLALGLPTLALTTSLTIAALFYNNANMHYIIIITQITLQAKTILKLKQSYISIE